ncbi:MAG TPA: PAS domain-containing protein, partial [Rectinemataceae bacterium]|nr:PAS domain-containing protein [Rectinemataceae bacterium]
VMYYSDSPHRLFPRSPAAIGRTVQNCHPQKSVDTVNKILAAFKNKEKDKARFWIEMGGRFILIEYYALYDGEGTYKGTLEVSQDLTDLRALQGQHRLLDWN